MQCLSLLMKREILDERLKELGWSPYRLAQEVSRIRSKDEEREFKPSNFVSSVRNALEKPNSSSIKTLETLVKALDGELVIRWRQKEQIVTGEREVTID